MGLKINKNRYLAAACRDSYYEFLLTFWDLICPEKYIANWHIQKLCQEVQDISERVFAGKEKEYDELVNCPPGTSKSIVVSIAWQPWAWTRMASCRFITGSHSERLSWDFSRKSRDLIKSERYRSLFPEIELRDDQDTKGYFANTRGGIRYACGVGGSVIGIHAHVIPIDDPIDPQGALSKAICDEANYWINETLSERRIDKRVTPYFMIQQRLGENDPSGDWLESGRKIRHICLPADCMEWEVKPPEWKEFYSPEGLLDPVRMPWSVLEEAKVRLKFAYAGQYGQVPSPRGGSTFEVDNLVLDEPVPTKFKRVVRAWDKAGTRKGGAFTVGVKMGEDLLGRYWVLDVVRGQWSSGKREKIIKATAERDGVSVEIWIEQEPGDSGKDAVNMTIRNLTGFRAFPNRVSTSKELRADIFSVQVNSGNVYLAPGAWRRDFIHELRFFPASKYKDQVDAASSAIGRLAKKRTLITTL